MTNDELQALWVGGASIRQIARQAKTTPSTIACLVKRLRIEEGLERWPYHDQWVRRDSIAAAKHLRGAASTLPPLASLTDKSS